MPFIASLADVKDHLQIAQATTTYDVKLQGYIDSASIIVQDIGDVVLPNLVTETYDGGGPTIMLLQTPVISVTSITEYSGQVPYPLTQAATPAAASGFYGFQVDLASGLVVRLASGSVSAFAAGKRNVFVTYTAGWASVPANVILALKELVAHWWRWGQQGNRAQFSDGAAADMAAVSMGYAVPNRVIELLRPLPGVA